MPVTMKNRPVENHRLHYAWTVLGMGTLVVFGALGLARFGYSVVLPSMQRTLGLDNTAAGALGTANLVGYLASSMAGGALASRYGPRRVIAVGLAISGAGMLLTGFAGSFFWAAACRALTGIGSGAANVPVMALLASWFVSQRRGLASGVAVSGSSFALIIVGPLVPQLLSAYGDEGWRVAWGIFGAATLALAVATYVLLRNRPSDKGLAPWGAGADDVPPAAKREGADWRQVYRSRAVWHLGLVYVAFGFSYIIYMTFFVKRLVQDGGYTQGEAGRLFMVMGWASLACGLLWGTASDVIGRRWALVLVYLLHAVAFGLFALAPSPAGFTFSAVLFGLSAWSIPAIMAAACGDTLGPRLAPAALGFITLFFGAGQALGPIIGGAMADSAGTFASAFALAAGVALVGAVGAAFLRKERAGTPDRRDATGVRVQGGVLEGMDDGSKEGRRP